MNQHAQGGDTKPRDSFTVVGAGLTAASKKRVAEVLPDCHVLASRMDSWQVVRFCKLSGPTILIVDYESLVQIKFAQIPAVEYLSAVEVLVLCREYSEDVYNTAVRAGCSGVLALDSEADDLKKAVEAIAEGDLWYPRAVLSALVRRSVLSRSISQKGLTARETEILRLLGMDKKNQDIADELFISRETVRWHLRTLYSKIGVTKRSEAQQYALKYHDDVQ
jgi:DNA-binding NarL/FixJ family response regulator